MPEYGEYCSVQDYEIDHSISWDYRHYYVENNKFTKIILIPKNNTQFNFSDKMFYAKVYYTQIVNFIHQYNKITSVNIKDTEKIEILSYPTATISECNTIIDHNNLLFISKLNINSIDIFKNQMKSIINTFFNIFKINNNFDSIFNNITITYSDNYYNIYFYLLDKNTNKNLLIAIKYMIKYYFHISYNIKVIFIVSTSNVIIL